MKFSQSSPSSQESSFWDLFVLRQDGEWLGLRASWSSLRRVATLLALVMTLAAVGVSGWLFSRWQVFRLERALSREKLRSQSLEIQREESARAAGGQAAGHETQWENLTVLPALSEGAYSTQVVRVEDSRVSYDPRAQEFHMSFELVREGPRDQKAGYYWIVLVHGVRGVVSFPPAFHSGMGEALEFHRGQAVEPFRIRRSMSARFRVRDFFESGESAPVYATLLIYDEKGTLVLRSREEIAFERMLSKDKNQEGTRTWRK